MLPFTKDQPVQANNTLQKLLLNGPKKVAKSFLC